MLEPNPSLYMGTKMILAVAMSRQAYTDYRGWALPADENGSDEGYLVEYVDGGQPNDARHIGYISWSPAAVFEKHYQSTTNGMSFPHALEAVFLGYRVARKGWNGKGIWIAMSGAAGTGMLVAADNFWSKHARDHAMNQGGWAGVLPTMIMKTADNDILMGWLASQSDMFSDDWVILPAGDHQSAGTTNVPTT